LYLFLHVLIKIFLHDTDEIFDIIAILTKGQIRCQEKIAIKKVSVKSVQVDALETFIPMM